MPSTIHELDDLVVTAAKQIDVTAERRALIETKAPAIAAAAREVLKATPKEPNANRLIGVIYLQRKDYNRARRHLAAALAAAPREPDNHYFLGRLHLAEKNAAAASTAFQECLR
ncbi:tetratricopeptide repeat protein, partial [Mycobacterium tuberculosis]|nr:tetratricopeptide repeat protein [Mycobacterium tuberculosis]